MIKKYEKLTNSMLDMGNLRNLVSVYNMKGVTEYEYGRVQSSHTNFECAEETSETQLTPDSIEKINIKINKAVAAFMSGNLDESFQILNELHNKFKPEIDNIKRQLSQQDPDYMRKQDYIANFVNTYTDIEMLSLDGKTQYEDIWKNNTLNILADISFFLQDYSAAINLLNDSILLFQKHINENMILIYLQDLMRRIIQVFRKQGHITKARSLLNLFLKNIQPYKAPITIKSLEYELAFLNFDQGQISEALNTFLNIHQEYAGQIEKPLQYQINLKCISECYFFTENFKEAEKFLNESINIFQLNNEERDNILVPQFHQSLGYFQQISGFYDQAIINFQIALDQNKLMKPSLDQAEILIKYAFALIEKGQFLQAQTHAQNIIQIIESHSFILSKDKAIMKSKVSHIYMKLQDFKSANAIFGESDLREIEKIHGTNSKQYADAQQIEGVKIIQNGEFVQGLKLIELSINTYRRLYGNNNYLVYESLVEIAEAYTENDAFIVDEGIIQYRETLKLMQEISKQIFKNEQKSWNDLRRNLFQICMLKQERQTDLMLNEIRICQEEYPKFFEENYLISHQIQDYRVSESIKNLEIESTGKIFDDILIQQEKLFGQSSLTYYQILLQKGKIALRHKKFSSALESFELAEDIFSDVFSSNHPLYNQLMDLIECC